ncbi:uncharacterized protein [Salvelinus sp. IW2-2015]|uniref:uncharacterized protein n=1 Tax=Salvelinus sp. IW2-2015 TaxID=2691554 RepID=UPI0038D4CE20
MFVTAFLKFEIPLTSLSETKLYDGSGTEVDGDVFEKVVKRPDLGVFKLTLNNDAKESSLMSPVSASSVMGGSDHESVDTIILSEDGSPSRKCQRSDDEAKNLIESILKKKPGGEVVIKEYAKTKSLTDCTRRKMINILVSAMTETHGTSPLRSVRETFAQGIVSLFPYLKDPYTANGYEHYYDPNSGEGYLSYRIKTIQRNLVSSEKRPTQLYSGGPTAERESSPSTLATLSEDQCREAISLMKHSSDEETEDEIDLLSTGR